MKGVGCTSAGLAVNVVRAIRAGSAETSSSSSDTAEPSDSAQAPDPKLEPSTTETRSERQRTQGM